MRRTHYANEIENEKGTVVLAGWVQDVKELARIRFVWLRDRSGIAQVTISKSDTNPDVIKTSESLGREDVIAVEGTVVQKRVAKVGSEITPSRLEVITKAQEAAPLDMSGKIGSNLDARLDWRVIDLRRPENSAIFQIQSKLAEGMIDYLRQKGFVQVFTPCLLGGTSEGGAEVFKVDFFGKEAFLRQDPQLHRQLCIAAGLDKIYDLGPNWRAELSHTPQHLCEHRGMAVELGFIADERDVMAVEQDMVIAALERVKRDCSRELALVSVDMHLPKTPFPEMRYPEIYEILEEYGRQIPYGNDIGKEGESILSRHVREKHKSDVFFINRYPSKVKPFYVMRVDEEPQWARSVDFVFGGIEQSSGGQREHRYEKIIEQMKEQSIGEDGMKWFTEPFKF